MTEPRLGKGREWVSRPVSSPPSLPFLLRTSLHLCITRALYAWHWEDKVTHFSRMTADKSLLLDLRSAQTCLPSAQHSGSRSSARALRPSYSGNDNCSAVARSCLCPATYWEPGNAPPLNGQWRSKERASHRSANQGAGRGRSEQRGIGRALLERNRATGGGRSGEQSSPTLISELYWTRHCCVVITCAPTIIFVVHVMGEIENVKGTQRKGSYLEKVV